MPLFYDQLNRQINLPSVPQRIISVVPSQTELLFYLGLDKEVIGITKFCIHPAGKFKAATKIGGTKQLDLAHIKALRPDLIIANKEENDRSQLEELMQHFPVWISDIYNLEDALDMIEHLGALTGKSSEATALCNAVKENFSTLVPSLSALKTAYFIWRKPYMVAGKNTFIDNMLQKCGLVNVFAAERYPEVSLSEITEARPDVILLSSEPYPFKEKHIAELSAAAPAAIIKLVDGEMFSWYGSRLLKAPGYFQDLINSLHR
ncbi:helical backbone metal receptor [Mucilaginibacter xinganensis]|uniref:Cobalamin-binding protein n=1 Tax=Mucilaginibacter xinganensis TaxID=1234841 RepID=A0A223NXY8_9SPHI|nr:helical backbone metal receptor [Mucilaginibacter xinganensis]ASU34686.1 cobalamin-binding protein [Mucilaginibacter xinganensis]